MSSDSPQDNTTAAAPEEAAVATTDSKRVSAISAETPTDAPAPAPASTTEGAEPDGQAGSVANFPDMPDDYEGGESEDEGEDEGEGEGEDEDVEQTMEDDGEEEMDDLEMDEAEEEDVEFDVDHDLPKEDQSPKPETEDMEEAHAEEAYAEEAEEEEEEEEEEEDEDEEGEDDGLQTLFMGKMEPQVEVETLASIEGVVGLALSPQTRQFFGIEAETPPSAEGEDPPPPQYKWLSWKKVKLHMFLNGEESEFFPHYTTIKYYPDVTMLLGVDSKRETGEDYFFCLTIEARNNVLNPKKRKRVAVDLKKQQEQMWNKLASKVPRKWKGFGSEVEVNEECVIDSRPLISIQVYRYRKYFGSDYKFENSTKSDFATFKSEPTTVIPTIQAVEVDRAIQVMAQTRDTATQTGFSFKRNKMLQYSTQAIAESNVENIMNSKGMFKFFKRVMPRLDKVLQQNEMVDLLHDDYRDLRCKRGHEMEFSKGSMLLSEYQTYSDFKHSRGRTVTCMTFHPVLEDVVVMATAVDLTWERRIDAHSKTLMEPNYVLFWDLRDSAHPHIMLDAPADVFSFAINPSDPHLVCGGCANGQIAFWDLGRTYFELRAKIQDKKNVSADAKGKQPSFLDKLKDSSEALVCPLIPVAGISNLDSSHKRAVTSVAWIPNHIELGKNGTIFDSRTGRSTQFMSVAGDGTLRLWDFRPQKKVPGVGDDDDEDAVKDVIKVNKWAHLENNQWKFHFRYTTEDKNGTAPLFITTISICEKKVGDQQLEAIKKKSQISKQTVSSSSPEGNTTAAPTPIEGSSPDSDPKPGMPKKKGRILTQNPNANSTIFIGTEMGEVALIDWLKGKDGAPAPNFGNKTVTNIYIQTFHHGAITSIKKSPFYPELLLVVGGGIISIWKETCSYPIFLSGGFDVFPWCAIWSNSRPAVFYVGNREGSVSIWDLMDRSNGPVLTQTVSNVNVTAIGMPKIAASASKNQYLAVTDSEGVLIVLLLPKFYARPLPNEEYVMTELMEREDNRMSSWMTEKESRADKIQNVNYTWEQSRIQKTSAETNREEILQERRLNSEYVDFIEFEKEVVDILKQDEPVLPTIDTELGDEFDALILAAQKQEQGDEEDEEDQDDDMDDFDDFGDFDDEDYDDDM